MLDLGDFVRIEKISTYTRIGISTYGDLRREDFSIRGFLRT